MRWLITALCVSLLMSGSLCFAQEAEKPANPSITVRAASRATKATVSKATEAKTLVGKIAAVTLADPAKGIKPEIVVKVKSNKKAITLLITSTTSIYDVGWNAVTLENLKVDSKARVKYSTTKEGTYEALAINLIK
jgi:hypothetical protein